MYGLIFDCFEQFVIINYGQAKWDVIVKNAFVNYKKTEERRLRLQQQASQENSSLFKKMKDLLNQSDGQSSTMATVVQSTRWHSGDDPPDVLHDEDHHRPPTSLTRPEEDGINYNISLAPSHFYDIISKIDEMEENYVGEGWSTSLSYPDELFWSLCDVAATEVNIPKDEVIRACGFYFIDFIRYVRPASQCGL
jgi:hypothetical protein